MTSGCPATVSVLRAPAGAEVAGPAENGRGVLPNGRRVAPAGNQIRTETLPLNLALTPDERHLLITNDGYGDDENRQFLQVLDTATTQMTKTEVPQFMGLAISRSGEVA